MSPLSRRAEFDVLWKAHGAELMARCMWLLRNRADAEDACSRAALQALESWTRPLTVVREPRAWLIRVINNTCISIMREHRRRRCLEALELSPESGPGADAGQAPEAPYEQRQARRELRRILLAHIRALPSRLREPVVLRLVIGKDYRCIAGQLGITEANARKRVQLGREALRQALNSLQPEPWPVHPGASSPRPRAAAEWRPSAS